MQIGRVLHIRGLNFVVRLILGPVATAPGLISC